MRSLPLIALIVALILTGVAAAESGSPAPSSSGSATVDELAATFKRGLDRVGAAVETGAADLWAAGKAAYQAGTLHEREAAHDAAKTPDVSSR